MKTFRKVIALVLVFAFAATMFVGCSNNAYDPDSMIFIGLTGPLTGPAAVYGTAVKNSVQLAVDEINEAGGLKLANGESVKFYFSMLDDQHNPTTISTNYASLIGAGMQVSLGTVTTKPGLEFSKLAKDDNVFFLTPSATGDDIPQYDNGYQMCFSDNNQGTAAAQYFNANYQGKKVGAFYKSDDPYSTGILANFEKTLDSSFTITKASFAGDGLSFDTQVETLKDCDVIFMPIYYTPASAFMTKGVNKIKANAVYYGCDGLDGIDTAVKGFDISTIPQEVSYLSHFNSQASEGPAAEFIKKYEAKFDTEKEPLNQFGAAAYDCVWAIYRALEQAVANGKNVTATTSASDMCTILQEVFNGDFTFVGITGAYENGVQSSITWDANGYVNKTAVKYVVKAAD